MANQIFEQVAGKNQFMQKLNELKSQGGDPNRMIKQLMDSGRVTQAQYNSAVQRAQTIKTMFGL